MNHGLRIALLVAALVGCVQKADAGFLEYLTGQSNSTGSGEDGIMSFAVYDNPIGSDWRTLGGLGALTELGGTSFTGAERSIFFFQYERTGGGLNTLELDFPRGKDPWISVGNYADTVFNFSSLTNNTDTRVPADKLGTLDGTNPFKSAIASDPTTGAALGNGTAKFQYFTSGEFLTSSSTSSIMVLASYASIKVYPRNPDDPNWEWRLPGGGYELMSVGGNSFYVPVANPEPSSLALMGLGLVSVMSTTRVRKRRVQSSKDA